MESPLTKQRFKRVDNCPALIFALTQDHSEETQEEFIKHPFICAFETINMQTIKDLSLIHI